MPVAPTVGATNTASAPAERAHPVPEALRAGLARPGVARRADRDAGRRRAARADRARVADDARGRAPHGRHDGRRRDGAPRRAWTCSTSTPTTTTCCAAVIATGHSRFPVYEGQRDNIIGILMAKDLLKLQRAPELNLRTLLRPAVFVPESQGPERAAARLPLQPQPPGDRHRRVRQHRRADHDRGRAGGDRRRDRGRVRRQGRRIRHLHAGRRQPARGRRRRRSTRSTRPSALRCRPRTSTPSAAWSRTSSAACRGAARR